MEINIKTSLVTLALVVAVSGWSSSLRVRFGIGDNPGVNTFVELPQTVSKAVAAKWALTQPPSGSPRQLALYCAPERTVCGLYEDTGHIAGLQVALPQSQFKNAVLDWKIQGFTEWTPPAANGGEAEKYWSIQQYFVSEDYLKKSKDERIALRDTDETLQDDGIWLTGFNKQLMKVPDSESEIAEKTAFTKQGCFPAMGLHYFYNTTKDLQCTSDTLLPWFLLVDDGELIGTGFKAYGQLTVKNGQKDYFERPPADSDNTIIPRGPSCLNKLTDSTGGVLTMHIYYVDKPWLITCNNN